VIHTLAHVPEGALAVGLIDSDAVLALLLGEARNVEHAATERATEIDLGLAGLRVLGVRELAATNQTHGEVQFAIDVVLRNVLEDGLDVANLLDVVRHALRRQRHLELVGDLAVLVLAPQREEGLGRLADAARKHLHLEEHDIVALELQETAGMRRVRHTHSHGLSHGSSRTMSFLLRFFFLDATLPLIS